MSLLNLSPESDASNSAHEMLFRRDFITERATDAMANSVLAQVDNTPLETLQSNDGSTANGSNSEQQIETVDSTHLTEAQKQQRLLFNSRRIANMLQDEEKRKAA